MNRDAVRSILSDLPPGKECKPDYDYWNLKIFEAYVHGKTSERLTAKVSSPASIKKLRQIETTAKALYAQLTSLEGGSYLALAKADHEGLKNDEDFRSLIAEGIDIDVRIEALKLLPWLAKIAANAAKAEAKTSRTARGAPSKIIAVNVARIASKAFQDITGQKATVAYVAGVDRSPFIKFLDDLFTVLGIKASPAAMSRQLLIKKSRKKVAR